MGKKAVKAMMTGISLTPYERNLVLKESERRGLHNFSATIRQLLREWEELSSKDNGKDKENRANS